MSLKARITEDMKTAMRARERARLGTIRLLLAAIQQKEVDERTELDEAGIVAVIEKMLKQRKDAMNQYAAAGRQDLAEREEAEMRVLSDYLPQPLSPEEITTLIRQAQTETGAAGARDMGKMMAWLKPRLAGRADMGQVSSQVKTLLD